MILYEAAYAALLPVMLKGPTGCGKTRFVEDMAWRLKRPLITVACDEDMTASDLVGRFLRDATGTRWQDGPLTTAANRLGDAETREGYKPFIEFPAIYLRDACDDHAGIPGQEQAASTHAAAHLVCVCVFRTSAPLSVQGR